MAILTKTQQTQLTFLLSILTNQDFIGPPVTSFDSYNHTVCLLVPPIVHAQQSPTTHTYHGTLTVQFQMTLAPWQKPLFGPISQLQPTKSLLQINQSKGTISLVSNALVQKSKQSSFVWIIAHDTCILWRGVGLAPGHAEDMTWGKLKPSAY